jgi:hypothetical protein
MKKIVVGSVLALLATAGAVYAYRTVQANANRGDRPFTFVCPMTGKPLCHSACTANAKCEKADHPSCCTKAAQASP